MKIQRKESKNIENVTRTKEKKASVFDFSSSPDNEEVYFVCFTLDKNFSYYKQLQ